MDFFDTHAHLTDPAFATSLAEVIDRANQAGVQNILCVGTTVDSSRQAIEIAHAFANVYAAVGIHPNHAHEAAEGDWKIIESLVTDHRVVAVGETGLDRHWKDCPWDIQLENFRRHWRLSQDTQLPVIVHSRDCDDEMVKELRSLPRTNGLQGVMHSFTGTAEMARACLELGLHISFAGMVTFKKSAALRELAAAIPADRLLIETDAPYLSPEPKRSIRPNEPAWVVHTAACIAQCRGMSLTELGALTTANATRLFGIDGATELPCL